MATMTPVEQKIFEDEMAVLAVNHTPGMIRISEHEGFSVVWRAGRLNVLPIFDAETLNDKPWPPIESGQ